MAENHMLNKKANLQAVRQRLLDSILVLFAFIFRLHRNVFFVSEIS